MGVVCVVGKIEIHVSSVRVYTTHKNMIFESEFPVLVAKLGGNMPFRCSDDLGSNWGWIRINEDCDWKFLTFLISIGFDFWNQTGIQLKNDLKISKIKYLSRLDVQHLFTNLKLELQSLTLDSSTTHHYVKAAKLHTLFFLFQMNREISQLKFSFGIHQSIRSCAKCHATQFSILNHF